MTNRAYAMLETKALDESRRVFKGIATTPEADRVGDTIDPMGAKFTNPLVLLHQHRHDMPIGSVVFKRATKSGIEFEASIPVIEEPGSLKDRVDTAWLEIKHGMVRGVSIGFRPIKYAYKDDGGIEFQEIEIYELSSVSVPANASATIQTIKALSGVRNQSGAVPLIARAAEQPREMKGSVQLVSAKRLASLPLKASR